MGTGDKDRTPILVSFIAAQSHLGYRVHSSLAACHSSEALYPAAWAAASVAKHSSASVAS
jgi:hypothetical protein